MANNISCYGQFTGTIGNPTNIPLAFNFNLTGSTDQRKTQPIALGSEQSLDTASFSNIRYVVSDNIGNGSISISTNVAGTQVIGTLQPNDILMTPWTGSIQLYAQAYVSASVLQYYLINP